jgi:division protein CdvB (Snf7/Vps24/ESCRT-III family)
MPPLETLSLEEKKEIKSLQTKISTYSKRLEKAIEENKPKSIATNQKNIEEAQKKLEKFEKRPDQREKIHRIYYRIDQ